MNIFGIGGAEFILIFLIMLIVAGPKRMIAWSYVLGQYVAKFRRMWEDTVDILQKEFDEAGVDIKVPREMPTRGNLNRQAGKLASNITRPVKDTLDDVGLEMKELGKTTAAAAKQASETVSGNGLAAKPVSQPRTAPPPAVPGSTGLTGLGTWSRVDEDKDGFGTWSSSGSDKQA